MGTTGKKKGEEEGKRKGLRGLSPVCPGS